MIDLVSFLVSDMMKSDFQIWDSQSLVHGVWDLQVSGKGILSRKQDKIIE